MTDFAVIFISACLVNNLILDYLLGVSPAVAVSRKVSAAIGLSCVMICVLTVAAVICYPIKFYLLVPFRMEYLELVAFVFVIALSVILGEKYIRKYNPQLHEKISVFIPLTLVNTAALGIALLNVQQTHGLIGSLFFGLGAGIGFGLVITVLSAIQERVAAAEIPKSFRGLSILLITLGIISMAFMGFTGIVKL